VKAVTGVVEILEDTYTLKMNSTELLILKNAVREAKESNAGFYNKHPALVKVLDEFLLVSSK
jgi:hypothetical protein